MRRFAVGTATTVAVSRVLVDGSVSRGTCRRAKGTKACARSGCQAPDRDPNENRDCSDRNLRAILDRLGLSTNQMLVVGTRHDGVGFADTCRTRVQAGGFRETDVDYAAFFARASDGIAIATHLADCGFAAVEWPGGFGFIHLTRLNMSFPAARHFLRHALGHYGTRTEDVRIRLISGISGRNFPQHFMDADGSRPEDRFPHWFAKGLLRNRSRSLWLPSDGLDPAHVWEADNVEMMRRQLLDTGIGEHQLDTADMLDPGDLSLGHASHSSAMRGLVAPGRDAYVIAPRALIPLPAPEPVPAVDAPAGDPHPAGIGTRRET